MFRPEANVAGFVPALMIEAKCFETRLRGFLVKPTARENAAGRFDAQRRRACPLVGNYIDFKARILKMIFVGLVNRPVIGVAIMRQDQKGLIIFAFTQFANVMADLLSDPLDVIEHANLPSDELRDPNCQRVGSRTRPAEIKKGFVRQQGVSANTADATLGFGLSQLFREIGTLKRLGVFTFPNVIATLRVKF